MTLEKAFFIFCSILGILFYKWLLTVENPWGRRRK